MIRPQPRRGQSFPRAGAGGRMNLVIKRLAAEPLHLFLRDTRRAAARIPHPHADIGHEHQHQPAKQEAPLSGPHPSGRLG